MGTESFLRMVPTEGLEWSSVGEHALSAATVPGFISTG